MKRNEFTRLLAVARKKHRLTQADVCVVLGMAEVSSISNWENGKVIPMIDTVIQLARLYYEPMLVPLYLEIKGGGDLMPYAISDNDVVMNDDLRITGMNIQKEYNDVAQEMPRLINILHDGVIDSNERGDYENFIQQAKEFMGVLMPIILREEMQRKKLQQDGNLVEAVI